MFMSIMEPIVSSYKARNNLKREHDVAARLGVERTALANYRKGIRRMPDKALAELAKGLQFDLGEMVAAANIGLEATPETEKQFWLEQIHSETLKNFASTWGSFKESYGSVVKS